MIHLGSLLAAFIAKNPPLRQNVGKAVFRKLWQILSTGHVAKLSRGKTVLIATFGLLLGGDGGGLNPTNYEKESIMSLCGVGFLVCSVGVSQKECTNKNVW